MNMWKKSDLSDVRGVAIVGDLEVPPTTWWNSLWLKFFIWKTAAVFMVVPADAKRGYRLGYKAIAGKCLLQTMVLHDEVIAVRIGRENRTFFAVGLDGREIRISPNRLTTVQGLSEQGIRLL
jgi:hypothetical protein